MCFSAQASFAAGAALLPAGVYCAATALRKDRRFLVLALVPLAFGVQQLSEGFVWLGLEAHDAPLTQRASQVYLFFAIPFWPFWISLSLLVPETRRGRKKLLTLCLAASLVWFWFYFPIGADPQTQLQTEETHHSINYKLEVLPARELMSPMGWKMLYLVAICLPFAVGRVGSSSGRWGSILGGVLVAVLFAVSYVVYWYAFLSVWCFFAALLSLLLCHTFYQLPTAKPHAPLLAASA